MPRLHVRLGFHASSQPVQIGSATRRKSVCACELSDWVSINLSTRRTNTLRILQEHFEFSCAWTWSPKEVKSFKPKHWTTWIEFLCTAFMLALWTHPIIVLSPVSLAQACMGKSSKARDRKKDLWRVRLQLKHKGRPPGKFTNIWVFSRVDSCNDPDQQKSFELWSNFGKTWKSNLPERFGGSKFKIPKMNLDSLVWRLRAMGCPKAGCNLHRSTHPMQPVSYNPIFSLQYFLSSRAIRYWLQFWWCCTGLKVSLTSRRTLPFELFGVKGRLYSTRNSEHLWGEP